MLIDLVLDKLQVKIQSRDSFSLNTKSCETMGNVYKKK